MARTVMKERQRGGSSRAASKPAKTPLPEAKPPVEDGPTIPTAVIEPRRRLPAPRPELQPFARKLNQAMLAQNMSPSDLARAVWGTTRDYRGYLVARNRDRVGNYLAGVSYPGADNLAKIAAAVGLKPEELAVHAAPGEQIRELRGGLDTTVTMLEQYPGLAVLSMRKVVSIEAALRIMQILKEDAERNQITQTLNDEHHDDNALAHAE